MSLRRVGHAMIADTARITGEVTLGRGVSLWYGAAVRGDVAPIAIGEGTNVQDNAVVHCDSGVPLDIGARVTIGHAAVVHGRRVGDGTLIGMHATVLGESEIGEGCLIAAGALVPPRMVVPDGMLVVGVPGRVARAVTDEERGYLEWLPEHYVQLAHRYIEHPDDPKHRPWQPPPVMKLTT